MHSAIEISSSRHLQKELNHLKTALKANGCKTSNINKVIKLRRISNITPSVNERGRVPTKCQPYILKSTIKYRLLKRKGIKTIFKPTSKISQKLRSTKDQTYPMHTTALTAFRANAAKIASDSFTHGKNNDNGTLESITFVSALMAQNSIDEGHNIHFGNTKVLG